MIAELLGKLHFEQVSLPRVKIIADAIAELAPPHAKAMLDIGSSDGLVARAVADKLAITDVRGVDVKVQPNPVIPVAAYDGNTLPFADGQFDLVTICDVLHHTEDPLRVVGEALRVLAPDGALAIKDHFRWGAWSNGVLLAMDVIGNYKAGVLVRGTYLRTTEWIELIAKAGGAIDRLTWPLAIHALPWRIVTRSEYQFAMRVRKR